MTVGDKLLCFHKGDTLWTNQAALAVGTGAVTTKPTAQSTALLVGRKCTGWMSKNRNVQISHCKAQNTHTKVEASE